MRPLWFVLPVCCVISTAYICHIDRREISHQVIGSSGISRLWPPRQLLLHCSNKLHPCSEASFSASVPDSALPLPSMGAYLLHDHHGWWKCNRVAGATLAHAVVVASLRRNDTGGADDAFLASVLCRVSYRPQGDISQHGPPQKRTLREPLNKSE